MLKDILTPLKSQLTGQTELRAQLNTGQLVGVIGGNLAVNTKTREGGVSARTYQNGVYGFASAADSSPEAVTAVLRKAGDNAAFLDGRLNKRAGPLPALSRGVYRAPLGEKPANQQMLVDFATQIDDYVKTKYPDLASRTVTLSCECIERVIAVSDGWDGHQLFPRAHISVSMSYRAADGAVVEFADNMGGSGYFCDRFTTADRLYAQIDEIYRTLRAKAEGVYPEAGMQQVVLASNLAGILAHEAIGHTVEADMVMGGSVAGPKLNQQVASPLVSMTDFAYEAFGKPVPQPVRVDDEGTPAADAVIIENGILKGYMHSRASARHFGHRPTGNARAYLFSDEPLIRMRNTCILPGQSRLEDMISSIDKGYYLMHQGSGQADSTGEFMFGVRMGYEIRNGKLGKAIRDTTISGLAFDMLQTVDMISRDLDWNGAGNCGKKQKMPTGMGGPAIKARVTIGGR